MPVSSTTGTRLRILLLLLLTAAAGTLCAFAPPHPKMQNPPALRPSRPSERFGPHTRNKSRSLPQNVLVLRVQFSDLGFQNTSAYPDSLPHDRTYFERWMLHLTDFYASASRNQYILNYHMPDQVYDLSNTMAYYGADASDEYDARVPEMLQEVIETADAELDFSQYDAILVIHAGPGQESDVSSLRPGQIWSTFITRKDLQAAFDEENDDYPGLTTQDGVFIKEIVLVPESEFQDYFPLPPDENSAAYLFSIYGVLCHQFGHQLGLPTLFDNYSSNGASQGIGNWGLMGTGLWNANGFVPAQLSAWSRYYLGWENAVTVSEDTEGITVDHFLDNSSTAHRLYKLPISDKEYFLVENRQQNPDGSLDPYTNQPSFTFTLLDPSEQDYYPPPDSLLPYFNFMENRYKGCEWDFFLPGLGGPLQPWESHANDGSGLLVWHIDEYMIDATFSPDFEINYINYDASHKGVDLEEADGIQHLDTATFDYYKYGGPYDSFRRDTVNPSGDNDYFGQGTITVPNTATPDTTDFVTVTHLPTAESYYGGIPLEIYDISHPGNQMSFSVRFGWKLRTEYSGLNVLDACSVDYDADGENEIFYPMPDGGLFMWKDEEPAPGFPIITTGSIKSYAWDGEAFYLAYGLNEDSGLPMVSLKKLLGNELTSLFTIANGKKWAAPVMTFGDYIVMPLHAELNQTYNGWSVGLLDKSDLTEPAQIWGGQDDSLAANLAWFRDKIYAVTKSLADGSYHLNVMTQGDPAPEVHALDIPADSTIFSISIAPLLPGSQGDIIIQTPYAVYLTDLAGQAREGYPLILPFFTDSQVTFSDTDKNGTLDYLVSGENTFAVYDHSGGNMLTNFTGVGMEDSLFVTSGILSGDLDGDGRVEYIGAFSRNRLAAFEDNQRYMTGFPTSQSDRSRNLPFVHRASDGNVYAWLATDNGKIYRSALPQEALDGLDPNWYCRFANLQRTSSREAANLPNQYATISFFVPGETYVFPNPLRPIYEQELTFQIMTSQTAEVEVSVFDIRGHLLHRQNVDCQAYLQNREAVQFPAGRLSSGVYLAVFKSGDHVKRIRFAVEK